VSLQPQSVGVPEGEELAAEEFADGRLGLSAGCSAGRGEDVLDVIFRGNLHR